ncbi:MAG: hypothetical protein WBA39_24480 [Rivularia sp. (in: cyanobacteria)]
MNSNNSTQAIITGVASLIGLAVAAIGVFWKKVTSWAKNTLFPFIEKHLPKLLDHFKNAFTWIDDKLAVPARRLVKTAWRKFRQSLLKVAIYFENKSSSKWVRKTTSYLIKALESKQVVKQVVEEEIDWDDLSPEIRKSWMKSNIDNFDIDYTAGKDENSDSDNLEMTT